MEHANSRQSTGRNVRFELLRVYAMLLVVICHTTIHLDWGLTATSGWKLAAVNTAIQGGQLGVAIFFMITGYFMVGKSFKFSRLFSTWLRVFVYSLFCLGIWLASQALGPLAPLPMCEGWELLTTLKKELLPISSGAYWFMTSYFMLLLVSPFLNALFANLPKGTVRSLTCGLAIASSMFVVGLQMLPLNGLTKAVTCYVIGGSLRLYGKDLPRLRLWQVAALTAVCMLGLLVFNFLTKSDSELIAWLGWATYYHDGPSILWMAAAAATLAWASAGSSGGLGWFWRAAARIAPYTFGVYLLHENFLGYRMLWTTVNGLLTEPHGVAIKMLSVIAIALALLLLLSCVSWLIDSCIVNRLSKRVGPWLRRLDSRLCAKIPESSD